MDIIKEFMEFLKAEKKWWLLPVVLVLLFVSIFIVFLSGSAISPFLYTVF